MVLSETSPSFARVSLLTSYLSGEDKFALSKTLRSFVASVALLMKLSNDKGGFALSETLVLLT